MPRGSNGLTFVRHQEPLLQARRPPHRPTSHIVVGTDGAMRGSQYSVPSGQVQRATRRHPAHRDLHVLSGYAPGLR